MPPRVSEAKGSRDARRTKTNGDASLKGRQNSTDNSNARDRRNTQSKRSHDSDIKHVSKRIKRIKIENSTPSERLQVYAFGSGESGELGLGAELVNGREPGSAEAPRRNHNLDPNTVGVVQVAVGGMHCAALTHDGQVLTWGVNDSKALGRDTTWTAPEDLADDMTDLNPLESTPAPVSGLEGIGRVVQVAACDNATFVLSATGDVYGWGSFFGNDGAYGFRKDKVPSKGKTPWESRFQCDPISIPRIKDVKALATGVNHVLALTHDGNVYAWGSGQQAELGRRVMPRQRSEVLAPRLVKLPRNSITQIFAGFNHNFALDNQGRVWAWGLNKFGQVGGQVDEAHLHVETPITLESLSKYRIRHIAGGFHHSLACTDEGEVLAWGRCNDGQLGLDISTVPNDDVLFGSGGRARIVQVPVKVPGVLAHFVAAGIDNSFAIDKEGKVSAWGFSDNYRTGLRTEDTVEKPTAVKSKAAADVKFTYAGSRGQFSVIAGC